MRRGKHLGLKWAFKDSEQAYFKERLALLGLGLEDRLSAPDGIIIWWSTSIYYIAYGCYASS